MYIFSLKLQRRVVTIPRGMHDLLFYLFIEKGIKILHFKCCSNRQIQITIRLFNLMFSTIKWNIKKL